MVVSPKVAGIDVIMGANQQAGQSMQYKCKDCGNHLRIIGAVGSCPKCSGEMAEVKARAMMRLECDQGCGRWADTEPGPYPRGGMDGSCREDGCNGTMRPVGLSKTSTIRG